MAELSPSAAELSRKSQTAILRALASVGQRNVAESIGKSETWVSRFASDNLKTCADLLAASGLKVVPAAFKCYAPEYVASLRYFAQRGIVAEDDEPPAPAKGESPLDWDGE